MTKPLVLVVEDNRLVAAAFREILSEEGYQVSVAKDGRSARRLLKRQSFNAVVLDVMLPDVSGQDLLKEWRQEYPDLRIIVNSGHGDIPMAVDCLKAGAYDFLTKPVETVHLVKTVENALEHSQLSRQVNALTELSQRGRTAPVGEKIIAGAPGMEDVMRITGLISQSDFSCVLVTGESGAGKGLFARTIHHLGRRGGKPFVEVNCSGIPATLIESELFGHRRGAFTDAKEDRIGLFEMADQGTIFLDEIGDMELKLQAKLLHVIEGNKFRRLGSTADVSVDVAIIAATNQDLENLVAEGKFRTDLYYRLNVVPLIIPPLRDRMEDTPELAEAFLNFYARKFGKEIKGFADDARAAMMSYSWPGNVRELRNTVERGCLLCQDDVIAAPLLMIPGISPPMTAAAEPPSSQVMTLADAERLAIHAALRQSSGNKNGAARILGIHRSTLYKKLVDYNIEPAP